MYEIMRTRQLRRAFSAQGWALLIYYGILYAVVNTFVCSEMLIRFTASILSGAAVDIMAIIEAAMSNSGWGYMITILVGFGLLVLWKEPKFCFKTIWKPGKPMKLGSFLAILAIFISAQLGAQLLYMGLEFLFNLFGASISTSMEEASLSTDALSMFLYVGLGAPISEEILFRGLMLRSMEPYGKKFAIFTSALMFGLYHCNIIQIPFAFMVGLVLGYVTVEYNIVWAIVLHMFNNLILSDTLTRLTADLPQPWNELWFWILTVGAALIGGIILIVKHRKIKLWLKMNPDDRLCARAFWTAPGILVLVAILLATTAFSLMSLLMVAPA